jgi:hypothetical protein
MITISVYIDDGIVYSYDVKTPESAREHMSQIIKTGYRHCTISELVHFPPHRLLKVKATGEGFTTNYSDKVSGT